MSEQLLDFVFGLYSSVVLLFDFFDLIVGDCNLRSIVDIQELVVSLVTLKFLDFVAQFDDMFSHALLFSF